MNRFKVDIQSVMDGAKQLYTDNPGYYANGSFSDLSSSAKAFWYTAASETFGNWPVVELPATAPRLMTLYAGGHALEVPGDRLYDLLGILDTYVVHPLTEVQERRLQIMNTAFLDAVAYSKQSLSSRIPYHFGKALGRRVINTNCMRHPCEVAVAASAVIRELPISPTSYFAFFNTDAFVEPVHPVLKQAKAMINVGHYTLLPATRGETIV